MKVTMFYLSGNYATIDTTVLTVQDGVLLDDAYIDVSDLETAGVVLTRASYNVETAGRQMLPQSPITIVRPEELEHIGYVTVDGQPLLKRTEAGFERCIVTALEELLAEAGSLPADEPEIDESGVE